MGAFTFSLPPHPAPEALRELAHACISGGPDNMPYPTRVRPRPGVLVLERDTDESGVAAVPWLIPGAGFLMGSTASLMERAPPYRLVVELARGKVNQVRGQAADWQMGGLHLSPAVAQTLRDATRAFGQAVTGPASSQADDMAQNALVLGYHAGDKLVEAYVSQVFQARHQRQPRLDTLLGCHLGAVPVAQQADAVEEAFNSVVLPLAWADVEVGEGDYRWDATDALLSWAEARGLTVAAGPLVEFSLSRLPPWIWQSEQHRANFGSFVCDYVEVAVKRYQDRIRTWHVGTAANVAPGLAFKEDELLWLCVQMAATVRRIDPSLEVILGIAQPWGEYLAGQERMHSPFVFADTLLRNGVHLASLDVELVMGLTPAGSYCRGLVETSRLLDLYAILGVPLQVTLAYPGQGGEDPLAEPGQTTGDGYWRTGFNPESQASWAAAFASLALAKPYTRAVHWAHFSDAVPHRLPHCGLADAQGCLRPALQTLGALRRQHLR
jgi:hypothetical protein